MKRIGILTGRIPIGGKAYTRADGRLEGDRSHECPS